MQSSYVTAFVNAILSMAIAIVFFIPVYISVSIINTLYWGHKGVIDDTKATISEGTKRDVASRVKEKFTDLRSGCLA